MTKEFTVVTSVATVAIFDLAALRHRIRTLLIGGVLLMTKSKRLMKGM
jgi:hypothetical protein